MDIYSITRDTEMPPLVTAILGTIIQARLVTGQDIRELFFPKVCGLLMKKLKVSLYGGDLIKI